MKAETYTVTQGWADRAGNVWVYVRGLAKPYPADAEWPEGTAVRIVNGRAVK